MIASSGDLLRALLSAPEGREQRRPTNAARYAHMLGFVERTIPGLDLETRRRVAAGIVSVSSVFSWLFMRDNLDMNGAQAGEAAATTGELILAGADLRARGRDERGGTPPTGPTMGS